MPRAIRLGFLGAGRIFQEVHVPFLCRHAEVEPLVLCDIREEAIAAALRRFGIRETTSRWQDVVDMRQVDAVVVTLPNHLHAAVAERALRGSKHVLCEKPAGITADEAAAVHRAALESGCVYMLALPHRFDVQAQLLKRFVESGQMGRIQHVRAGIIQRNGCPGGWFTQRDKAGGGALVHLGTPLLDLILWLMDFPPVLAVNATCWQKGGEHKPAAGARALSGSDVEDAACCLLRLEGNRSIMLEVAWQSHTEGTREFLELHGDRGGASLWPLRLYQDLEGTPVDVVPHHGENHSYQLMERHFIDCVLASNKGLYRAPLGNSEDGLRLAHLISYLYLSASSGKEVEASPWPHGFVPHKKPAEKRGVSR